MNTNQYNDILAYSYEQLAFKETIVGLARNVCQRCGVPFPLGQIDAVRYTLRQKSFYDWFACSKNNAQKMANEGVVTVGLTDNVLFVISPEKNMVERNEICNEAIRPVYKIANNTVQEMMFFCCKTSMASFALPTQLELLQQKFPHNTYWKRISSTSNNSNGYTKSGNKCFQNSFKFCNRFYNPENVLCFKTGSLGFAMKCGFDVTGKNCFLPLKNHDKHEEEWKYRNDLSYIDLIKPGDIISFQTDRTHTIYVTHIERKTDREKKITFGSCGVSGKAYQIKWNLNIEMSYLREHFLYALSAPMKLQ